MLIIKKLIKNIKFGFSIEIKISIIVIMVLLIMAIITRKICCLLLFIGFASYIPYTIIHEITHAYMHEKINKFNGDICFWISKKNGTNNIKGSYCYNKSINKYSKKEMYFILLSPYIWSIFFWTTLVLLTYIFIEEYFLGFSFVFFILYFLPGLNDVKQAIKTMKSKNKYVKLIAENGKFVIK